MAFLRNFIFYWEGLDSTRTLVKGYQKISSRSQLSNALNENGIVIVVIKKIIERKTSKDQVSQFTHKLFFMIERGLSLSVALQLLANQTKLSYWKYIIVSLSQSLEEGMSFSEALYKFPVHFDNFYISMIRAGEQTGRLPFLLKDLAVFYENMLEFKNKTIKSLYYPLLVLILTIALGFGMLFFVMPKFKTTLDELHIMLPVSTQLLIRGSSWLRQNFYFLFLLGILPLGVKKLLYLLPERFQYYCSLSHLPLLKSFVINFTFSVWFRVVSVSYQSGLSFLRILDLANETVGHPIIRNALEHIAICLKNGDSLQAALSHCKYISEETLQLIELAEASNNLEEMLGRIAKSYQTSVEHQLKVFLQCLEPCLMIVLGLISAALIITLYSPIMSMNTLSY